MAPNRGEARHPSSEKNAANPASEQRKRRPVFAVRLALAQATPPARRRSRRPRRRREARRGAFSLDARASLRRDAVAITRTRAHRLPSWDGQRSEGPHPGRRSDERPTRGRRSGRRWVEVHAGRAWIEQLRARGRRHPVPGSGGRWGRSEARIRRNPPRARTRATKRIAGVLAHAPADLTARHGKRKLRFAT